MTKWHKGPPPEIGWWPASLCENNKLLRWWDGEFWSIGAFSFLSAEQAGHVAKIKCVEGSRGILWTERWWLK